jgi:hypothetical protein
MRLLLLRPIDVLYHQRKELFPEFEFIERAQQLRVVKPAVLDILPDLWESPPFPVQASFSAE